MPLVTRFIKKYQKTASEVAQRSNIPITPRKHKTLTYNQSRKTCILACDVTRVTSNHRAFPSQIKPLYIFVYSIKSTHNLVENKMKYDFFRYYPIE